MGGEGVTRPTELGRENRDVPLRRHVGTSVGRADARTAPGRQDGSGPTRDHRLHVARGIHSLEGHVKERNVTSDLGDQPLGGEAHHAAEKKIIKPRAYTNEDKA